MRNDCESGEWWLQKNEKRGNRTTELKCLIFPLRTLISITSPHTASKSNYSCLSAIYNVLRHASCPLRRKRERKFKDFSAPTRGWYVWEQAKCIRLWWHVNISFSPWPNIDSFMHEIFAFVFAYWVKSVILCEKKVNANLIWRDNIKYFCPFSKEKHVGD